MVKKFGPSRKASTGHTAAQFVYLQFTHGSVTTYAIYLSRYCLDFYTSINCVWYFIFGLDAIQKTKIMYLNNLIKHFLIYSFKNFLTLSRLPSFSAGSICNR